MISIDKGIPVPKNNRGRPAKYPFASMDIGDSFVSDGDGSNTSGCKAYNAARQYGRAHGMKFSGRKEGEGKVRIWRVE